MKKTESEIQAAVEQAISNILPEAEGSLVLLAARKDIVFSVMGNEKMITAALAYAIANSHEFALLVNEAAKYAQHLIEQGNGGRATMSVEICPN